MNSLASVLPKDAKGWTIFTPSPQSIVVYVSSSKGDDITGRAYHSDDANVGGNPFTPNTTIRPYKTFAKAFEQTREGQPDWILIRRGDVLYESIKLRSGKSQTEPSLVSSYIDGPASADAKKNPIFKTGKEKGFQICCGNWSNIAVRGLDFYAHTRDPNSLEYSGSDGSSGFNIYVGYDKDNNIPYQGNGFLLEGNRFRYYTGNVIQGPGAIKNLVLRRNSIFDNYSANSHSQGLYTDRLDLVLEENYFDHNGWLLKKSSKNKWTDGAGTIYNHNTYFSNSKRLVMNNNVFLRPSSIHNKFTANNGEHSARNISIINNLYYGGEIGISIGGNKDGQYRFNNIHIKSNTLLNIGETQATNRTLGWGIEATDWDTGSIENNFMLNQVNTAVDNTYGISVSGTNRDVNIHNNVFFKLYNAVGIRLAATSTSENINITNNMFNLGEFGQRSIQVKNGIKSYSFANNNYQRDEPNKGWFSFIEQDNLDEFSIGGVPYKFDDWVAETGETGATLKNQPSPLNTPTLAAYMKSLNKEPSAQAYIRAVRLLSYSNWDDRYSAARVNAFIQEAFK